MPQRPKRPAQKKIFPWTESLKPYIKEYKCPDCKSYALYTLETSEGETFVRCRKCGYRADIEAFARTVMSFTETNDGATIRVPDFLGGPDKVVSLSPLN